MPPAPVHRLKSVFPPGFDNQPSESKGHSGHYTHSTEQLYVALIDNYSPMTGAELIKVRSAWYGKQTNSAEHEFILIQVEDVREEGQGGNLVNYLLLDRNVLNKNARSAKIHTQSQTSIQGGSSVDTFRVSYDGDLERLLNDCNLRSYRLLEQLQFSPDSPLLLYELVALAYIVSYRNQQYHTSDSGRLWYAGVIWDSLCELNPGATRTTSLERKKGKNSWLRYTAERPEVVEICEQAKETISVGRARIDSQKAQLEALIRERISRMETARTASLQEPPTPSVDRVPTLA